jgi:hypothetical protein
MMLLVFSLASLGLAAGIADAEITQKGTLRVKVTAELDPRRLPREKRAPVAVSIDSGFTTTDGSVPPQLRTLRIELDRHGRLDTAGLAICHVNQIQPASTAQAVAACRAALVGRGSFSVTVLLRNQEPYATQGRLLLFNGVLKGKPVLLGHIYSPRPFANSFVIPFRISSNRRGRYGIVLAASLPKAFTSWGHVTAMRLRLGRRYSSHGERRSFASAGCPAADGFQGAVFPLARISFSFLGGLSLTPTVTSTCTVRR